MKKALIFTALAVFAAGLAYGGTITVTQPAGGTVTMTCPVQIAWTASGITSNVRINLIRPGGALVGLIIGNQTPGSSPYTWTVGAPAVVGEQYRVRVTATDGSGMGESAVFTVVGGGGDPGDPGDPGEPGTITNVHLNGSSPYCLGTGYTISWTVTAVSNQLKVQLIRSGGALVGVIATGLPAGTSTLPWTAGNYTGGPAAADTNYKIRVAATDNSVIAESAAFELKTCDPGDDPGDGGDGGVLIDPGILEKLKRMRAIVKWWKFPFPWPGPDPGPDPWEVQFDMSKLREALGVGMKGSYKLLLLKNGAKIQELGVFGSGKFLPDTLKGKMNKGDLKLMQTGKAKFSLAIAGMNGQILNEVALEGAEQAAQLK